MTRRVQQLIDTLHLQPHPEGGFYRETFRSQIRIDSPIVNAPRAAMTDIYFLLSRGQVSRFHRVAHDELWNFYNGEPLKLWHYDAETQHMSSFLLGPPEQAEGFKYVIPGKQNPKTFDLISLGADGQEGGQGDNEDIVNK